MATLVRIRELSFGTASEDVGIPDTTITTDMKRELKRDLVTETLLRLDRISPAIQWDICAVCSSTPKNPVIVTTQDQRSWTYCCKKHLKHHLKGGWIEYP